MFSSIFGKSKAVTEKVEVICAFVETDCDMGGMERCVHVPLKASGVATINSKGKVTIKMDTVQDPVFSKKLTLHFDNKDKASKRFKFLGTKELL